MRNLPKYVVRESAKTKSIRLKVSVPEGVVVVVPKGFDQSRLPAILKKKRVWLDQAVEKIESQRKFFEPEPPGKVPERVMLRAIGREWGIEYRPTEAPWVAVVERASDTLLVYGDIDNVGACKKALQRWLSRTTHDELVTWLRQLSRDMGMPFQRALVKSQRTRWASCSRHRTISLNQKLLFIPPHLVRYVFIHELAHTIYMDHSSKFWAFVEQKEPRYESLDEELRKAWRFVPAWLAMGTQPVRAPDNTL